ncbi:MAG: RHS repeat protein, partial [Desulfobacterales bacterium]|nr:RHS repeat protein [Desulfobacterales bacterium]
RTASQYDNEGRLLKTTDGAGNEIVYHYDESAAPVLSDLPVRIDYPTYTRIVTYDQHQRITKIADISGEDIEHARTFQYDDLDRLVAWTDEEGFTTRYEYDGLDRITKITDPMGGEIKGVYDNRDNLIHLLDPKNGSTFYTYDKNNRLTKLVRPMKQETSYEYDEVGNQTAVIDSKGQRIEYEYNEINRLVRVNYFTAADHEAPVKIVDFTYDVLGNLLTWDDGIASGSFTYDAMNRKTGETTDYGPFTLNHGYTYLPNGLKKSFTGPNGDVIGYSYDENNRLA